MAEFYRVPADEATGSDVEACEHSLQKWRGALPENCEKHGVKFRDRCVMLGADYGFEFGGESCALCQRHDFRRGCNLCPIVLSGSLSCYKLKSAYMMSASDPLPMIATLEKALAWAMERETAK